MDDRTVRPEASSARTLAWLARLSLLIVAVLACSAAALFLYLRWQDAQLAAMPEIQGANPNLNPFERFMLRSYLASRAEDLTRPAGSAGITADFIIAPGQNAQEIAAKLAEVGVIQDAELFRNYVTYYGLDSRLAAGTYRLNSDLTVPDLAVTLTSAFAQEIELRFIEGWRLEEMANYLDQIRPANIDAQEFLDLATGRTDLSAANYDFLASLPDGTSMEGFLFPDTYRLSVDADAAMLVRLMLDNFGEQVSPAVRQSFGVQGLTVHQAVTLASIVQREAAVEEERPIMVGVFLNRYRSGMLLQADPTVQYAVGYQPDTDTWWKSPLSLADLQVNSPYNTYEVIGLPPGPISNPGLGALEVVAAPVETEFLYFVVDCTAETPGSHVFSRTYDEHLANVQRCR